MTISGRFRLLLQRTWRESTGVVSATTPSTPPPAASAIQDLGSPPCSELTTRRSAPAARAAASAPEITPMT